MRSLVCLSLLLTMSSAIPINEDVRVSDYVRVNGRYRRAFPDDDRSKNRTNLCNELKLKTVVDEHASCYRRAENGVVNKIATDNLPDLHRSLCTVVTEKVDCINSHASKCLAPERVDLMRMNFLSSEISKSNRNDDMLGQDFINSCPVLRNYQTEFVKNTFGSNRCSYEQVYNLTESREECKLEALIKKREKEAVALDFLTNLDREAKRTILFQLYCDFQWNWLACYENTTFSCTSDEKKEEILDAEKSDFRYIEENFREMGVHFSFQDCANYTINVATI